MPTASVGAPPVRDRMRRLADVLRGLRQHVGRDGEAPAGDRLRPPARRSVPISAAGLFMAK